MLIAKSPYNNSVKQEIQDLINYCLDKYTSTANDAYLEMAERLENLLNTAD